MPTSTYQAIGTIAFKTEARDLDTARCEIAEMIAAFNSSLPVGVSYNLAEDSRTGRVDVRKSP